MSNSNPIGIFDSGIGGLSIAQQINQDLPQENILYFADQKYLPYGTKPEDFLIERALKVTDFLLKNKAKAIVVACNTATAISIKKMREKLPIPIIGIEPGLKPASELSLNKKIGVLATTQTTESLSFQNLLSRFNSNSKFHCQACPGLAQKIEEDPNSSSTYNLVKKYLQPLIDQQIDTLVLGCTHYSFIIPTLKEILGEEVTIIEPSTAVSRQVEFRLNEDNLLNQAKQLGKNHFFSSLCLSDFKPSLIHFWDVNPTINSPILLD